MYIKRLLLWAGTIVAVLGLMAESPYILDQLYKDGPQGQPSFLASMSVGSMATAGPPVVVAQWTSVDPNATVYALYHLKNRASTHSTPDAMVRLAGGFDATKQIRLIIYNHGFYTGIKDAYHDADLAAQMAGQSPNTILILPEWQIRPGAASSNPGHFGDPGVFAGMIEEAFAHIAPLQGRSWKDVASVTILGHSAGYKPSEVEVYDNGIADKINCLTLLDALYDHHGFDPWLQDNMQALASGNKRFYNFFFDTDTASKAQAQMVEDLLTKLHLPTNLVVEDYNNGGVVMTDAQVKSQYILFKYSTATVSGLGEHFSMPNLYFGVAVRAADGTP